MSDKYYNPKFRVNIFNKKDNMGTIEQGNLTFVKDGKNTIAYVDISDSLRYPVLPVWEEIDAATQNEHVQLEQIGELVEGAAEYEVELLYVPQPGTLTIYFDGNPNYFHDTQVTIPQSGVSPLISAPEYIGTATLHYPEEGQHATIIITLDRAPATGGGSIYADYYKKD